MIDSDIALRSATPEDQKFLRAVFASTRTDELAALGDASMIESFVGMQFDVQERVYRTAYPTAENRIIFLGERPIGRMLVDRTPDTITLVDIGLLSEFRNRRIGSLLVGRLIDEAAAARKSVRLSVFKFNRAVRLYERLGFFRVSEDASYIQMQWVATSIIIAKDAN